jgi:SAM-dependent methyltransferase
MKKKNVKCPICESNDYKNLYFPRKEILDPKILYGAASGIQGTQFIVKCINCEMIYENPRFDEEIILDGYSNAKDDGHDTQYNNRVKSFFNALKKHKKFLPKNNAKVLDIGTSSGAFLKASEKFGYNAYGLEPSKVLTEFGKKRGLKIINGTIDNHSFEDNSFDLICLWDVIEHLSDPKNSLIKIKSLLKEDGILLINYPDIGTPLGKLFGDKFWWIISVHLHHFTKDTITKICNKTGYNVISSKMYWQTLEFGYLIDMAIHYKIPTARFFKKIFPDIIKKIPIPYYASQTTILAKKNK